MSGHGDAPRAPADLTGRRALVTGAGGRVGGAVAVALAAAGAEVQAIYRRGRGDLPAAIPAVSADLGDESAVAEALRSLRAAAGGPPEIVVHCAGSFRAAPLAETAVAEWEGQIRDNLTGAFLVLRAVLPAMLAAGWGRIVTVGSRASLTAEGGLAAYSAAKGGLLRLTEAAAAEGRPRGVTANCILPGIIDTPANRRDMPGEDASAWVSPAAVAGVCLLLCSESAACISGAAIPVGGA